MSSQNRLPMTSAIMGNKFPRTGSLGWPAWIAFQRRLDTGAALADMGASQLWSPQMLWTGNSMSTNQTESGCKLSPTSRRMKVGFNVMLIMHKGP